MTRSTQLGWSEGSLVSAENIVLDYFGASPPWWQTNVTSKVVQFGPEYDDFENIQQIRLLLPLAPLSFHK